MQLIKGRGPVESLNRERKARMIEAFLEDFLGKPIIDFRILDVGCGNGQISAYFSFNNYVSGVDVQDKRADNQGVFDFKLLTDEALPFEDNDFDIVISHHVIEHVNNQLKHMTEIRRVLDPRGLVYLGCPNKNSPFMAGHIGNNSLLTWKGAIELFYLANLSWEEVYTRLLSDPERYFCDVKVGKYLPSSLIKMFRFWYPSHCFVLRPI